MFNKYVSTYRQHPIFVFHTEQLHVLLIYNRTARTDLNHRLLFLNLDACERLEIQLAGAILEITNVLQEKTVEWNTIAPRLLVNGVLFHTNVYSLIFG